MVLENVLKLCPGSDFRPFLGTYFGSLHYKNNFSPSPIMATSDSKSLLLLKDEIPGLFEKSVFSIKLASGRKGRMQATGYRGF